MTQETQTDKVKDASSSGIEGLSFEEALEKLEKLISEMEKGGQSLDSMIKMADDAAKLSAFCQNKLNILAEKVQILIKDSPAGPAWGAFPAGDSEDVKM